MTYFKENVQMVLSIFGIGLAATGGLIGIVLLSLAPTWLMLSVLTSAAKSVTTSCGTTWKIEPYIQGDWFCPKTEEEKT